MYVLIDILNLLAGAIADQAHALLSFLTNGGFPVAGETGWLTLAFALAATYIHASGGVLSDTRRWNGRIKDKFAALDSLIEVVEKNQSVWKMPDELYNALLSGRDQLQELISKCTTNFATKNDRIERDSLLRSTIDLCRIQVKFWAYGKLAEDKMTTDDIHKLGFLLPGETGGRHQLHHPTDEPAEVNTHVVSADIVRVVLNNSAGKSASRMAHGWPAGVRYALIVIKSVDGNREIHRRITMRLRNHFQMPKGSHGQQFFVEASFLKHVDDIPRFGAEKTFTMPFMTEDIVDIVERELIDNDLKKDVDLRDREIELLREEVRALKARLGE
jgi:hypothetical protein